MKGVFHGSLRKFHSEILRNAVSVNAGISVNKGFDIEANFHSFDFRRASIVAISRFTTFDQKQKHGQDGFVFFKASTRKTCRLPPVVCLRLTESFEAVPANGQFHQQGFVFGHLDFIPGGQACIFFLEFRVSMVKFRVLVPMIF